MNPTHGTAENYDFDTIFEGDEPRETVDFSVDKDSIDLQIDRWYLHKVDNSN